MTASSTVAAEERFQASDLAFVAVFAALLAALSLMPPIPIGPFGVPITLQTLGVALAGLCLGPWRGGLAVLLYLVVGAAGLPVFSGGAAGLAPFAGPTAGYLVSFPIHAFVIGLIARAITKNGIGKMTGIWLFFGLIASRILVMYPLGTLGIARATDSTFFDVWAADLAYWPGDAIKSVIAVLVALAVYKAFPRLMR